MANTDSTYARRAMQQMQDPRALDAYSRQTLGHSPAVAQQLLAIHASLSRGQKINPAQVRQIADAFTDVPPHVIRQLADDVNSLAPNVRSTSFLACLAGDWDLARTNDLSNATQGYKDLAAFVTTYEVESISAGIAAKREQNTDPDIAARHIEREPEDRLSARRLIEAQLGGADAKHARNISDAAAAGHPMAEALMRDHISTRAEMALDKLKPEAAESQSLRETVSAATEWSESREVAEDLGYIDKEQP